MRGEEGMREEEETRFRRYPASSKRKWHLERVVR
jgi:hypothetical protein